MQDINDIIWPKIHLNFSFGFIIIFWIILFFIGFFYLLRYYTNLRQLKQQEYKEKQDNEISKKQYFLDKLNILQKNCDSYNKSEFFALLNDLLREFLEYKGLLWSRNMTFKELEKNKKHIDTDLFEIIKNTYFEEFREDESELDRKEVIKKIKNKLEL